MRKPLKNLRTHATYELARAFPSTLCMARSNLVRQFLLARGLRDNLDRSGFSSSPVKNKEFRSLRLNFSQWLRTMLQSTFLCRKTQARPEGCTQRHKWPPKVKKYNNPSYILLGHQIGLKRKVRSGWASKWKSDPDWHQNDANPQHWLAQKDNIIERSERRGLRVVPIELSWLSNTIADVF